MIFIVVLVLGSVLMVDQIDLSWHVIEGPAGPFAVFFSFLALILVVTRILQLRAMDQQEAGPGGIRELQKLYSRAQRAMHGLAAGGHFALLFGTQWSQYSDYLVGSNMAGIDEVIMLLPFVVFVSVGYLRLYPVDRIIRESMTGELLYMYEPVRPVWTRWQYLSFQLRFHILLVAVPLMLICSAKDLLEANRAWFTSLGRTVLVKFNLEGLATLTTEGMLAGVSLLIVVASPFLIRLTWQCRPLPAGALRDQLTKLAEWSHLKYRDVLLWPTYGIIVNAAVMGLAGRLRYIMLSDGLIESMTDGQIEGVFCHEAGHVKHHHLQFLLMFAFASMGIVGLTAWTVQMHWQIPSYYIEGGMFAAVILVWFVLFGRLSRAFERQADLFAAESLSNRFDSAEQGCGHDACIRHLGVETAIGSRSVCMAAAELVCSALSRAAALNAVARSTKTWRHGSIDSRCQLLTQLASDPGKLTDFKSKLTWIKTVIVLAAAITMIWAIASLPALEALAASGQLVY